MHRSSGTSSERLDVGRRLAILGKRVAEVSLNTKAKGGRVKIDGRRVGQTPLKEPVYVMPGRHRLTVAVKGFKLWEKRFTAKAGDHLTFKFSVRR